MNSAIYRGCITHTRFLPIKHQFKYNIFMLYLDLDELAYVFSNIPFWSSCGKKSLAYFRRSDYISLGNKSIKETVRSIIYEKLQVHHTGPVRMLTHLRVLGLCYNPVTFYYCFDNLGMQLEYVVAEITNTPWNERYQYLIDVRKNPHMTFNKCFHISPFMDMDMQYNWQFQTPANTLTVKMDVYKEQHYFNAFLSMQHQPITQRNMTALLLHSGWINYKVLFGIYWQAAKLYCKKCPVYDHPRKKQHE